MKEYYHMTGEEVCQSVNGTLEPLTESQVKEHIAKYGRNEIETAGNLYYSCFWNSSKIF